MISSKPVSGQLPRRRLFRREAPAAVLFEQWGACKDMDLTYSGNDTWDRMLQQGVQLVERFAQDGRVRIHRPRSSQQIQFNQTLASGSNRRGVQHGGRHIRDAASAKCLLSFKNVPKLVGSGSWTLHVEMALIINECRCATYPRVLKFQNRPGERSLRLFTHE